MFDFNQRALANFKEMGFKETGRLEKHYYKRGRYVDAVIIALFREEYEQFNKPTYEQESMPL